MLFARRIFILAVLMLTAWGLPGQEVAPNSVSSSGVSTSTGFTLDHEGEAVSGGEVCLFEAGAPEDPATRLAFRNVSCHPADEYVSLPPGAWSVFARHREARLVSDKALLVVDGNTGPDQGLLPVRPASALVVTLPSESWLAAVYVESSGAVIPLVPGEESILVPMNETVFPLFMNDDGNLRVGEEVVVEERRHSVQFPQIDEGMRGLAVGLQPDRQAFEMIDVRGRGLGIIEIIAGQEAAPIRSVNEAAAAFRGRPALALFGAVPATDELRAKVKGEGWLEDRVEIPGSGENRPLVIAPTTTLRVKWRLLESPGRLIEDSEGVPPCPRHESEQKERSGSTDSRPEGLWLAIDRCSTPMRCEELQTFDLEAELGSGTEIVNQVSRGSYFLRLGFANLPPARQRIEIDEVDSEKSIDLEFDRFFGKVTRGDDPVPTSFRLNGSTAISDPTTGEYFVLAVSRPRGLDVVADRKVRPGTIFLNHCTEERFYIFIPEDHPIANSRYDIELPENRIDVKVTDATTGAAISGTTVNVGALVPEEEARGTAHFAGPVGKTDEEGRLELSDLPPNRSLKICASHEHYLERCAEPFRMGDLRERQINLELEPAAVKRGSVSPPLVRGQIVWHRPDGTIAEMVRPDEEGRFEFKQPHAPGEIVSVVSTNIPLYVFRYPDLQPDEVFEIRFPEAPVRSLEVTLAPEVRERNGFIGVSIGDLVVPLNVFSWHSAPRGAQVVFIGETVHALDLLATGPIRFFHMSDTWLRSNVTPAEKAGNVDYAYTAAARALKRVEAGAEPHVVITP